MAYLYYIPLSRETILVGNPRLTAIYMVLVLVGAVVSQMAVETFTNLSKALNDSLTMARHSVLSGYLPSPPDPPRIS